jgi:hypothetical protein
MSLDKRTRKFYVGLAESGLPTEIEGVVQNYWMKKQAEAEGDNCEAAKYEQQAEACLDRFIQTIPTRRIIRRK